MNKKAVITIDSNKVYTKQGLMETLGVGRHAIEKMIADGRLPETKVGQSYYWTGEQVLTSLATPVRQNMQPNQQIPTNIDKNEPEKNNRPGLDIDQNTNNVPGRLGLDIGNPTEKTPGN